MRISDWSSDVCSSDLGRQNWWSRADVARAGLTQHTATHAPYLSSDRGRAAGADRRRRRAQFGARRSEEHTSELPSLMRISYAVLSLKKKNTQIKIAKQPSTHKH